MLAWRACMAAEDGGTSHAGSLALEPRLSLRLMQSVGVGIKDVAQALQESSSSSAGSIGTGRRLSRGSRGSHCGWNGSLWSPPSKRWCGPTCGSSCSGGRTRQRWASCSTWRWQWSRQGPAWWTWWRQGWWTWRPTARRTWGRRSTGATSLRSCMKLGLFKPAHKIVTRLALEDDFPDSYIL